MTVRPTEPTVKKSVPRFRLTRLKDKTNSVRAGRSQGMSATSASFSEVPKDPGSEEPDERQLADPLLGDQPQSKLPKTVEVPVLNGVTSDSDILADTVNDYGPCLNDEGETDAQVRYRVRPCNLFPHLRVRPAKYPAGWTLCRSGVCVRSLMLRAYNRNGDGRLEERTHPRTLFPLWTGR